MTAAITNPLASLSADETAKLTSQGEIRTVEKDERIFTSGENVTGIFCLMEGRVQITQPVAGQEVYVREARAGEWIGHRSIFTSKTYRGSAVAQEKTKFIFVPTQLLLTYFSANPDFALSLILMIARDYELAQSKLSAATAATSAGGGNQRGTSGSAKLESHFQS